MQIVRPKEMQEILDIGRQEYKFTPNLVLENVGMRAADYLYQEYLQKKKFDEIILLVGKGGNGADGLSIARHLLKYKQKVRAFLLYPSEKDCSEELLYALELARNFGVKVSEVKTLESIKSYFSDTQNEFFIIDAIFGTGVRHPLPDFICESILLANEYASVMISIDVPSGICADSGRDDGHAIIADCTLAIGLPKLGLFIGKGVRQKGQLHVVETGLPPALLEEGGHYRLLQIETLGRFAERNKYANKNSFGHSVVIGGSTGLTGALLLASMATLKVGAGLVSAVTWEKNYIELVSRAMPEMHTGMIPEDEEAGQELLRSLHRYNSIVIGPGLGKGPRTRHIVLEVLDSYNGPVIVDADAINVLSLKTDGPFLAKRGAPTLLTPHVGEFARFVGVPKEDVLDSPLDYLRDLVDQTSCAVLMKGPCSYVAFPDGQIYFNDFPNDGMATGGSGDVLAGVIAGLLAQRPVYYRERSDHSRGERSFQQAICMGVLVHTLAGKHAALKLGERAMTASSILAHLSDAFFEIEKNEQLKKG